MITEEDFDTKYTIDTSMISTESMSEATFETYGADLEYVQSVAKVSPNRVWTYVDADDGYYLINGMHFVNRVAYFITVEDGVDGEEYLIDFYDINYEGEE